MLYIIFFLVLMMAVSLFVRSRSSGDFGAGTLVFSMVALAIIGIIHVPVITSHCSSLATIKSSDALVAVYAESLSDLDKQMESLSKNIDNKTLFNADSPYRTLIETKSNYVSKLAKIREHIVAAKIKIQARKLGLMSHIVRWYGEE